MLTHQIEGGLYHREGKAITKFPATLPQPQSDLAQQIIKDPNNFDFLTLRAKHDERELENALYSFKNRPRTQANPQANLTFTRFLPTMNFSKPAGPLSQDTLSLGGSFCFWARCF